MATDYDAPRKNDDESNDDSIEELKGRRNEAATPTVDEDEAEAAALYAEYAIDFACQSTRWALAAALRAMELQAWAEEPPPGNENGKEKE